MKTHEGRMAIDKPRDKLRSLEQSFLEPAEEAEGRHLACGLPASRAVGQHGAQLAVLRCRSPEKPAAVASAADALVGARDHLGTCLPTTAHHAPLRNRCRPWSPRFSAACLRCYLVIASCTSWLIAFSDHGTGMHIRKRLEVPEGSRVTPSPRKEQL